jgi:hypothetical protein
MLGSQQQRLLMGQRWSVASARSPAYRDWIISRFDAPADSKTSLDSASLIDRMDACG